MPHLAEIMRGEDFYHKVGRRQHYFDLAVRVMSLDGQAIGKFPAIHELNGKVGFLLTIGCLTIDSKR